VADRVVKKGNAGDCMRNDDAVRVAGHALAPLARLFRANWRPVLLTYALYNVENLLGLAQPYVIGLAINGLLQADYGVLALLVGQHLAQLFVGTGRRMYDTRAFSAIYTDTATRLVCVQRDAGVRVSQVAARSSLSRELVDFFEHELKGVFSAAYGVVGGLMMLIVYDRLLVVFCVVLVAPLVLLSRRLARRSLLLNTSLNDQLEREVEIIEDGRDHSVREHYRLQGQWRVRLSDMEAWNFLQMEFFILALIITSLTRYCSHPGVEAGDIYAVFSYVVMFVGGLDFVPQLTQQLARLHDIARRVADDRQEVVEGPSDSSGLAPLAQPGAGS
jgi:hypothetical protein